MGLEIRNIPFGNVCLTGIRESGATAALHFQADPHGGPESLWFCFRLQVLGDPIPARVDLILENTQNLLGGGQPAHFRPVLRRENGPWMRQDAPIVETLPDGRTRATWSVHAPSNWLDFAFSFPYGPQDFQSLLEDTEGAFQLDTIGASQSARPLQRLSNRIGETGSTSPGVYLLARQHSGEVPGSWVLDGMLREFARMGDSAPMVWSVPFTNIDGVLQGDYGKDNFPYDLNRAWGQPPMRHETLVLKGDLRRWKERCRPILALDLHAPGASETDGLYAYTKESADRETSRTIENWVERFAKALGSEYAAERFARTANYRSRWETPTFTEFGVNELRVPALSLEVPYALARGNVLTVDRYREAGTRLARAIAES